MAAEHLPMASEYCPRARRCHRWEKPSRRPSRSSPTSSSAASEASLPRNAADHTGGHRRRRPSPTRASRSGTRPRSSLTRGSSLAFRCATWLAAPAQHSSSPYASLSSAAKPLSLLTSSPSHHTQASRSTPAPHSLHTKPLATQLVAACAQLVAASAQLVAASAELSARAAPSAAPHRRFAPHRSRSLWC